MKSGPPRLASKPMPVGLTKNRLLANNTGSILLCDAGFSLLPMSLFKLILPISCVTVVALLVLLVTIGVIACIRCTGSKKTEPSFHRLHSDDYFEDDYLNTPLGSKLLFNREYRDDYEEEEEDVLNNFGMVGAKNLLTTEYHDATSDEEFSLPPGRGIKD